MSSPLHNPISGLARGVTGELVSQQITTVAASNAFTFSVAAGTLPGHVNAGYVRIRAEIVASGVTGEALTLASITGTDAADTNTVTLVPAGQVIGTPSTTNAVEHIELFISDVALTQIVVTLTATAYVGIVTVEIVASRG